MRPVIQHKAWCISRKKKMLYSCHNALIIISLLVEMDTCVAKKPPLYRNYR